MDYAERLLEWFDENKRDMPWRRTRDPYCIWVSEVMLQQTQVDTVIPYYIRFVERFPTIKDLAEASQEEVYTYWQGLGYYRRAAYLHKGAQLIAEKYDGVFPRDPRIAKTIPGIGPYTLGAVMSIAFYIPLPAVDGNVIRVLSRQFLIDDDIAEAKSRKVFEQKVIELMPDDPNRFNQALMELGATVCTPKAPKCDRCPIQPMCEGYREGAMLEYPVKSKKIKQVEEFYKVLLIEKEGKYYLEKRGESGLLANMWGLPLIEAEVWKDQWAGQMKEAKKLEDVKHIFTHKKWLLEPYIIPYNREISSLVDNIITDNGRFIELDELKNYPIGTAFLKILKKF